MGMLTEIFKGASTEKKLAWLAAGIAGGLGFYSSLTDEKRNQEKLTAEAKKAAYEASTNFTKNWYAQKGNPNARRKKRGS